MSVFLAQHAYSRGTICCDSCGGRIPAGHMYRSERLRSGGSVVMWFECMPCYGRWAVRWPR